MAQAVYDMMIKHVRESYPNECCGLLLGAAGGNKNEVMETVKAENLNHERAHDRYELNPQDFLKADRYGREKNMQIVGIYHSHPDHPARPSAVDTERAWEGYSYVIVGVEGGKKCEANSFVLNNETKQFEQEELKIA